MPIRISTYNNEALASVCIGHYISLCSQVSLPKAMLVLPFLFHEQTARRLRGTSNKRSLDEFIIGNTECLINFNKRYIDFLPVSVNAIALLSEMTIIELSEKVIRLRDNTDFNPSFYSNLGKRAKSLLSSAEGLFPILQQEPDWSAYLKLKITL